MVQGDCLAHNRGITSEVPLPEGVADDGSGATGVVVFVGEQTPGGGPYAQRREIGTGRDLADCQICLTTETHIDTPQSREGEDTRQGLIPVVYSYEVGERHPRVFIALRVGLRKLD